MWGAGRDVRGLRLLGQQQAVVGGVLEAAVQGFEVVGCACRPSAALQLNTSQNALGFGFVITTCHRESDRSRRGCHTIHGG